MFSGYKDSPLTRVSPVHELQRGGRDPLRDGATVDAAAVEVELLEGTVTAVQQERGGRRGFWEGRGGRY